MTKTEDINNKQIKVGVSHRPQLRAPYGNANILKEEFVGGRCTMINARTIHLTASAISSVYKYTDDRSQRNRMELCGVLKIYHSYTTHGVYNVVDAPILFLERGTLANAVHNAALVIELGLDNGVVLTALKKAMLGSLDNELNITKLEYAIVDAYSRPSAMDNVAPTTLIEARIALAKTIKSHSDQLDPLAVEGKRMLSLVDNGAFDNTMSSIKYITRALVHKSRKESALQVMQSPTVSSSEVLELVTRMYPSPAIHDQLKRAIRVHGLSTGIRRIVSQMITRVPIGPKPATTRGLRVVIYNTTKSGSTMFEKHATAIRVCGIAYRAPSAKVEALCDHIMRLHNVSTNTTSTDNRVLSVIAETANYL